jgi:hypothetical protein
MASLEEAEPQPKGNGDFVTEHLAPGYSGEYGETEIDTPLLPSFNRVVSDSDDRKELTF